MKRVLTVILLTALCFGSGAHAQLSTEKFYVSGVLRLISDKNIIRLVQSLEIATSENVAISNFENAVSKQFSEYSLLDKIAMRESAAKITPSKVVKLTPFI